MFSGVIQPRNFHVAGAAVLLASTILSSGAHAQQTSGVRSDDIIVTATKRSENLQDVPMAITAIGTEKLAQLQVADFDDYARYLPSLSYQTTGPGGSNVYFRGVASGENANHSTSLPSVGTYLDEQPITTIQGALDIHIYDIARVEALAGPQGTLYGASSQAGTVRIITNKPDTTGFYGGADLELNTVAHGGEGYVGEAFVNVPISSAAAVRLVGWYDKDAGFIDNVPGTLNFPSSGIAFDNADLVEKDYNDVETYGGRAALKVDLDENWTTTLGVMGQKQVSHGFFGQESGLGKLQVQQFNPERFNDRWIQAALTIEGKLGSFDVTYAGAYLKRRVSGQSDYSDYAYFYDALYGSGEYFYDNDGNLVNPNQYIVSDDRFTKESHELRIASPAENRVRFIGGLFYQIQKHNIEQNYIIDGIADSITVPGTASDIWLTKQIRKDRDYAAFGEITADVTEKFTITLGARIYRYDNSLVGFFGYNYPGYTSNPIYECQGPAQVKGSPCTNLDKRTKDTDFIQKINLTYKFNDDALVYATASRGYRPGGINRRGSLPPYQPDFIDNYEIGFKTSWLDHRLRINGAIYQLDWTDIQLSFLGANGLSEVRNAGDARIRGGELDITARPVDGLTFTLSGAYTDAKITKDFCAVANLAFDCTTPAGNELLAPAGTRLPITAKFKGNALARYDFPIGSLQAHVQGSVIYEGRRTTDLRLVERDIVGDLPDYTTADASAGIAAENWSLELFVRNLFDKNGAVGKTIQCGESVCGDPAGETLIGGKIYTYPTQPRTIGIKMGTKF
ncbi:Outer membrane receptor proteins, mostly Fe transport [Sphingomonas laterariae]|uniref:Outer membrane receptor proteins, mostly Fe transport n=1 Tax=Edaphosphingomonas laterariae TaxID=861865 RepID=A0A239BGM2_9SPHN|nr:TonB-dependent receptor [Sphingomonas laterariae]SNS06782.1 Outer membrane receptor proteins, mostly Fe transport [Sphingomonas laterariae]